jgi:hypothetical protein
MDVRKVGCGHLHGVPVGKDGDRCVALVKMWVKLVFIKGKEFLY